MSDRTEKHTTPYDELVLVADRGAYAVLTINRPEKRNAMSADSVKRLREALVEVRDKKVVVLTGTGPSFCAGMDLAEAAAGGGEPTRTGTSDYLHPWTLTQQEIRKHPAVFIAAVNGYALGGGSTLIHSCDLALAAESAQIGAPEMGFGAFPTQAGPAAVKRLAPKHAAEVILTARRLTAQDAYRMAVVNRVVPDDELLDEAVALAEQLAGYNGIALDWGKKTIQAMEDLSWDAAMDYCDLTGRTMRQQSTSLQEGLTAFTAGHRGVGQGA